MTLWIVGMMGSGKSTIGPLVAAELGMPFTDTDQVIAAARTSTVARIWEEIGEDAFRSLESETIRGLAGSSAVVATGGGAPVDPVNRQVMSAGGRVVWLAASPEVLAGRLPPAAGRPLLDDEGDLVDTLAGLLDRRRRFYEAVADLTIDTGEHAIESAVSSIVEWSSRSPEAS